MNVGRRQFLYLAVVAVILIGLSGHGAWSQATRTIKIVVPVSPGGASDLLARLLGEQIGRAQGPTILIESAASFGSPITRNASRPWRPAVRRADGRALASLPSPPSR
jgi:hypothetical protein